MKFKRTLALILVILMVLMTIGGALMSAFADEKSGAEELYSYGFIKGNDGDLMLDQKLTRAQAAVLLSRMYNVEEEAMNYIYTPAFSDVKPIKTDWFYHYVSYAKAKGWINGYSDGTYKPNGYVTEQEWCTMLLNVLEYPSEWSTVVDTANQYNIHTNAKNKRSITRAEAFEAMWDAVNTPINGKSQTLGQFLGKLDDPDLLEETEDEITLPDNFLVRDVYADNLKEITVKFIGVYDTTSASNLSNYKVETTSGLKETLEILSVATVDDNTLRLILKKPVDQQANLKITIDPLLSKNGLKMDKTYTKEFIALDKTPPTIESIQLIGPETIKVIFSEPMKSDEDINEDHDSDSKRELPSTSAIEIKTGSSRQTIRDTQFSEDNRVLIITLWSDISSKKSIDFDVTGNIVDFVNFRVNSKVYTSKITKDSEAPKVTGYKNPSVSGVTLIWSEDINIYHSDSNNFYHTNATNQLDGNVSSSHIKGNEQVLHFRKHPMPEGEVKLYIDSGSMKDLWGNINKSSSVKIIVPEDTIDPTISEKINYIDEDEIELTISEPLKNDDHQVTDVKNYYLSDEQGKDVSDLIRDINYKDSDNVINIRFKEDLNGDYELSLEDLEDLSGNDLDDNNIDLKIKDYTAPDPNKWTANVYHEGTSSQLLKIDFHEPMSTSGKYSVLDLENYRVNGHDLFRLAEENDDLVTITAINNDQSVEIKIRNEDHGGFDLDADSNTSKEENKDVVTTRLADKDGNYPTSYENIIDLQGPGHVEVVSAKTTGRNSIEVTFDKPLAGIKPSDLKFELDRDVLKIIGSSDFLNDDNNTVIRYDFKEDLPYDADDLTYEIDDNDSQTIYGETLKVSSSNHDVTDGTPPALAKRNVDGETVDSIVYDKSRGTITIKFTEPINAQAISLATFRVENYDIDNVTVSGSNVKIMIADDDRDNVRVSDDIEMTHAIQDEQGNKVDHLAMKIQEID